MGGKQKRFSKESKAKVAPEAIRGISTTAEIVSRHQVHPNQIAKWKKQLLENAASLFADGRSKTIKEDDGQLKDRLYQQIGQLQFELDWLKKKSETPIDAKRSLVEPQHERLSIARQCELLGMSRAAYYYEPWEWDETALAMLRAIDEEYTLRPCKGKRRMRDHLVELGSDVGVKRTRTLLAWLGLEAIYPSDLRPSRKQESIRLQPEFYFFAPPPRIPSRRICRPGNFNKGFSARLRSIKK